MSAAAARVDDPIEHSSALQGLLAGLAVGAGAVLIGIAVVGTGGFGALALAAMVGVGASTGAGIGQLLGSLSFACDNTGKIVSGSPNVSINGKPAARAHIDTAECEQHAEKPQVLAQGSDSVSINGQPAARVGDRTACDGKISAGSSNVFIGGGTETTDEINPEVPEWLENSVLGLGLASGTVLAGPIVVAFGFFGGLFGSNAGSWIGGRVFEEDGDGQKISTFVGGFIGGGLGAKRGIAFDAKYKITANGLGSNLGNIQVKPKTASAKPSAWSKTLYNRGKFRSGVRDKVWENAANKSSDGIVRDPLTNVPLNKAEPWDMGHKPGYEHWKHVRSAEARGISRKQFLDEFNKAEKYRPELPASNRGHFGENTKADYYLGD
ncbi:Rhs protein [Pseudomonas syringae pv. maculicola]|uniref:GH-E family nuclease n=1 Tax=Pseudomonas syringae group genomosp. 3 TaxID=251701 RepID=UPI000F0102C4|nr:GH-E family nuclease [Pseudomonas syringae group genomosp. 3]RMO91504.1 Rhs protein [Pseudomonas syringae pv. maculicola]